MPTDCAFHDVLAGSLTANVHWLTRAVPSNAGCCASIPDRVGQINGLAGRFMSRLAGPSAVIPSGAAKRRTDLSAVLSRFAWGTPFEAVAMAIIARGLLHFQMQAGAGVGMGAGKVFVKIDA